MIVYRQNILKTTYMFVLVSQRARHICTVDGRNVCDVFPIFSLQILVVKARWSVVPWIFSNFPVLLDGHWFFGNVDLLIESLLASYHLEYKLIQNLQVVHIWNYISCRQYFYYFCINITSTGLKWSMELQTELTIRIQFEKFQSILVKFKEITRYRYLRKAIKYSIIYTKHLY